MKMCYIIIIIIIIISFLEELYLFSTESPCFKYDITSNFRTVSTFTTVNL